MTTTTLILAAFGALSLLLLRRRTKRQAKFPARVRIIGRTTGLYGADAWAEPNPNTDVGGYLLKVDGYRCHFHFREDEIKFL